MLRSLIGHSDLVIRHLLPLLVLAFSVGGCTCDCNAQLLSRRNNFGFDPNRKVDGHDDGFGRLIYNSQRVPELPTGPNKLQCWIVLSDQWQSNQLEHDLAVAVGNDPRLAQIKAGTYFNYYLASSPKFAQSGLKAAVGSKTPIVVLTRNDGAIARDGSGGVFVDGDACPQSAAEVIDMLCDSLAAFNPPPVVEGQTNNTPIVRESVSAGCPHGFLSVSQCPNCTPAPYVAPAPTPNGGGTISPIKPRPKVTPQWQYLGSLGILSVGLLGTAGLISAAALFLKPK